VPSLAIAKNTRALLEFCHGHAPACGAKQRMSGNGGTAMEHSPQLYAFIGLGGLAAVAIVISMVRGHFEKKR
jgi:hypothetical protein